MNQVSPSTPNKEKEGMRINLLSESHLPTYSVPDWQLALRVLFLFVSLSF